jgi:hypothetical protein
MEETKNKLFKITSELLNLPYYKNYAAASGAVHNFAQHEDAVASVFNNNGLTIWYPPINQKPSCEMVWNWIDSTIENKKINSSMPDNSFMSQPCGTHDSPDFIIKVNGIILGIECKSSADGFSPMYNSGGIKQNLIYVFCSKKMNSTTMYVGKDILTIEQQKLIDELIMKQRLLEKEYNEKLKAFDVNHRGISYYTRPMIQQSGGAEFTNYFKHSQKEKCQENVYKFIQEICEHSTLE